MHNTGIAVTGTTGRSVGRVLPHLEVKVVEPETGRTVGRGEPGELCTRGYSVMIGYWNDPERTAEAVDAEGWMHTGDLAVMHEDGYLAIVGRINDIQKELDQQARERGVRIISLSDFLAFTGYKTQRRLFVPGGDMPYRIQHGAKTPSTEASTGSRSPTGNTSGVYSKGSSRRGSEKVFRKGAE